MRRNFRKVDGGKRRRLKGLEEFETPSFVGRMARVGRRRSLLFGGALMIAVGIGGTIGWWIS